MRSALPQKSLASRRALLHNDRPNSTDGSQREDYSRYNHRVCELAPSGIRGTDHLYVIRVGILSG